MGFSSDLSCQWLCIISSDCQALSSNGFEIRLIMYNNAHLCRNMFEFCLQRLLVFGAGIHIFLQHCINTQETLVKRQKKM